MTKLLPARRFATMSIRLCTTIWSTASSFITALMRLHWIAQCMPNNNCRASSFKNEYQMLNYQHMSQSDGFLNFFKMPMLLLGKPQALTEFDRHEYKGLSPQEILFVKVMKHQGLLTLRILQADETTRHNLSNVIRNKAEAVLTAKIQLGPKYNLMGRIQSGWFDMIEDVSASTGMTINRRHLSLNLGWELY